MSRPNYRAIPVKTLIAQDLTGLMVGHFRNNSFHNYTIQLVDFAPFHTPGCGWQYFTSREKPCAKTATPTPTVPPPATPASKPTSGPTPTLVISLPFFDDFSVSKNGWPEGSYERGYADTTYAVASGKFQWTVKTSTGVFESTWPDLPPLSSFTLTVDAQQISGKPDPSAYAVIFEGSDGEQKHVFKISNNHYQVFYYDRNTGWQTNAPHTASNAILPGKVNPIKVISADSHFTFY